MASPIKARPTKATLATVIVPLTTASTPQRLQDMPPKERTGFVSDKLVVGPVGGGSGHNVKLLQPSVQPNGYGGPNFHPDYHPDITQETTFQGDNPSPAASGGYDNPVAVAPAQNNDGYDHEHDEHGPAGDHYDSDEHEPPGYGPNTPAGKTGGAGPGGKGAAGPGGLVGPGLVGTGSNRQYNQGPQTTTTEKPKPEDKVEQTLGAKSRFSQHSVSF